MVARHAHQVLRRVLSISASVCVVAVSSVASAAPVSVAPPPATPTQQGVQRGVRYAAPVTPVRVVRAFVPPRTRYGAGHLGVDLAAAAGAAVHAAGAGVVRFAGSVAGRGLVVVMHADGVSTEYEPLVVRVHTGDAVTATTVLGRVHGAHGAATLCAPGRCLHWGAKRDGAYFDPMMLLRPLGAVRLLPYP